MNSDIENQLMNYLNKCTFCSIWFDDSTDITSSARLSIISKFCNVDEVREEFIRLASIPAKPNGENICEVVINVLENIDLNVYKIVTVTTDAAPSMIGKYHSFVTLFAKKIVPSLIGLVYMYYSSGSVLCQRRLIRNGNILKLVKKNRQFYKCTCIKQMTVLFIVRRSKFYA